MAEDFPDIKPSYGAIKKSAPAVRTIQFGSGYQQRAIFGINQNLKVYEFVFNVTDKDATDIEKFLDSKDNIDSFKFVYPLFDSTQVTNDRFVCLNWTRTAETINANRITATFKQVPA